MDITPQKSAQRVRIKHSREGLRITSGKPSSANLSGPKDCQECPLATYTEQWDTMEGDSIDVRYNYDMLVEALVSERILRNARRKYVDEQSEKLSRAHVMVFILSAILVGAFLAGLLMLYIRHV